MNSTDSTGAKAISRIWAWRMLRSGPARVSIPPHDFQWFRYSLSSLVGLSIISTCIENGLHPLLLLTLPVIIAALSRPDYGRPFLWSEKVTAAVFTVYAVALFLAILLLVRRVPLPVLLVYFTFGTILARCLSSLTDRNVAQLIFLTVGLVLINCILTNHLIFGAILPLYIFALMVALVQFDMARSRNAAGPAAESSDAPPSRELVWYFAKITASILALTMVIFVFLPRPFLVIPGLRAAMARPDGLGDLEQRISYRDMVGMGSRDRIAFAADLEEGTLPEFPYWRGKVLQAFDGKGWVVGPEQAGLPRFVQPSASETMVYRFTPYNLQSNTVYVCGMPLSVMPGTSRRSLYISSSGEAVADSPFVVATSYLVTSVNRPLPAHRRQARANLSTAGVTPRIEKLAQDWTQGLTSPGDKARAIMARFTSRYRYVIDSPAPPAGSHPLEYFLLETREGHCEYFAGAFCLMLRSLGIPARVVEGFAGMEPTAVPRQFIVRFAHAHAWVEAILGDNYWTSLDPTPPAADQRFSRYWRAMVDAYDRLVRRWIKYVVYFDRGDQAALVEMATGALSSDVSLSDADWKSIGTLPFMAALGLVASITILLVVLRVEHSRRDVPGMYVKTMKELVAKGVLTDVHSWHERNLNEITENAPNCREAAERFTDLYFRVRFGDGHHRAGRELARARADLLRRAETERVRLGEA
jgi:hypothetical protein